MKVGLTESKIPVTNLAIGVPDLKCPDEVVAVIQQAAAEFQFSYVPSKGSRKALLNLKNLLFKNESNILPEKNLLLVNGAKYGIYLSLKTICNDGDSVLAMQPYWLSYPEIIYSLGLKYHSCNPTIAASGTLDFDLSEIEKTVREKNITAFVLNNPNNPSGKVFELDWIVKLNSILKKYNCWLLIDEVYRELVFNRNKPNNFSIEDENIIRIGSLSKSLSIPGLRLGYIAASGIMIAQADLFNQHIETCVNSLSCYLMENLPEETFHTFTQNSSAIYRSRFEAVQKILAGSKLKMLLSEASFYVLVDFGSYFKSGGEACDFLSRELNIHAVPGLPYGNQFEQYIRICLTLPENMLVEKFQLILNKLDA